jgi:hypothetical protein
VAQQTLAWLRVAKVVLVLVLSWRIAEEAFP